VDEGPETQSSVPSSGLAKRFIHRSPCNPITTIGDTHVPPTCSTPAPAVRASDRDRLEDDQIRVNVIPKKLKEGENSALTMPMSFTGTAVELDEQLPAAICSFVASHLELNNTLARAKEEMDAAAKAAQEEARSKTKSSKKPASEPAQKAEPATKEEPKKESESPRLPSLFDTAADTTPAPVTPETSPSTAAPPANARQGQRRRGGHLGGDRGHRPP
jgi:PRTRC genetic system protein E